MPGSYPRTENDVYEFGRDAKTQENSALIERVSPDNIVKSAGPATARSSAGKEVVEVTAGRRGAWSKELSAPVANTVYRVDSATSAIMMEFETDERGRTVSVSVQAEPGRADWGIGEPYPGVREIFRQSDRNWRQTAIGKRGIDGDVGFHLVAACIGGPGEAVNIVAGSNRLNVNEYMKIEQAVAVQLLKGAGLQMKIDVRYEGSSDRPESIQIEFESEYVVGEFELLNV